MIEIARYKPRKRQYLGMWCIIISLSAVISFGLDAMGIELQWWVFLSTMPVVILHEIAHGVLFKRYTGEVNYGMGWKWKLGGLYFYANSTKLLSRIQLQKIALAPQVITVVMLLMALVINVNWIRSVLFVSCWFNFLGGAMDIMGTIWLSKFPRKSLVHDTKTSCIVYQE